MPNRELRWPAVIGAVAALLTAIAAVAALVIDSGESTPVRTPTSTVHGPTLRQWRAEANAACDSSWARQQKLPNTGGDPGALIAQSDELVDEINRLTDDLQAIEPPQAQAGKIQQLVSRYGALADLVNRSAVALQRSDAESYKRLFRETKSNAAAIRSLAGELGATHCTRV